MVFLPWEIRVAFPGESQLRQNRATQPRVHAGCFSVSIIHRFLDIDYGILIVCTDVNACDCARGCTDTVRESALKADSQLHPHLSLHPHPSPHMAHVGFIV